MQKKVKQKYVDRRWNDAGGPRVENLVTNIGTGRIPRDPPPGLGGLPAAWPGQSRKNFGYYFGYCTFGQMARPPGFLDLGDEYPKVAGGWALSTHMF